MYDVIIIGAGPAGMTSAIYLRRAGKKVLVLEASSYGGQIINTLDIENYPVANHISGFDFADNLYKQVMEQGASIKLENVLEIIYEKKIKKVITKNNTYEGKALILATGTSVRKLCLEHEDELVGRGISYCATCDGAFYKKKKVMVVGGGNTALEDALYLSKIASIVYLVHRRDTLRGDVHTIKLLKKQKNVKFIYNSEVIKLNSDAKLSSVEVMNNAGKKKRINLDGLFIAIGRIPNNTLFKDLVNVDEDGYVIASEDCHTNIPGIFVAGDIRKKMVRQLVTATSDGAIAATEAIKYLT